MVLTGELARIKRQMGGNSFRLVAEGDLDRLAEVPGIDEVVLRDGAAKLILHPATDGTEILRQIVGFLAVKEFRSEEPELEEIFIQAVRDAP